MPPEAGATSPDPTSALSRYEFLDARLFIAAAFTWHNEIESDIIKLISKIAAAVVMDIKYCKLWHFETTCGLESLAKGGP